MRIKLLHIILLAVAIAILATGSTLAFGLQPKPSIVTSPYPTYKYRGGETQSPSTYWADENERQLQALQEYYEQLQIYYEQLEAQQQAEQESLNWQLQQQQWELEELRRQQSQMEFDQQLQEQELWQQEQELSRQNWELQRQEKQNYLDLADMYSDMAEAAGVQAWAIEERGRFSLEAQIEAQDYYRLRDEYNRKAIFYINLAYGAP